jgi:predicted phosphate transport protein (TIGR00153 family)
MLIFKKEKKARKLVEEHFAKTRECLYEAERVLEKYLAGDQDGARSAARQVIALESSADTIKREARSVLFSGAFLPQVRSEVCRLVDRVDSVADKAETVSHFIVNQTPEIPDEFAPDLVSIFGLCTTCYEELHVGLKRFFKPKGELESLQRHVNRTGELETEVDNLEAEVTRRIFASTMGMGEKLHLAQLTRRIADIADAAEDAADELEFAAMKSVV